MVIGPFLNGLTVIHEVVTGSQIRFKTCLKSYSFRGAASKTHSCPDSVHGSVVTPKFEVCDFAHSDVDSVHYALHMTTA